MTVPRKSGLLSAMGALGAAALLAACAQPGEQPGAAPDASTASGASTQPRPAREWLPFMDAGQDGGAHGIHASRLKFRADGLLESATRYPRTSERGWTPEQNDAGWYEYIERVIDCETGLYVDTSLSLLDKSGRPVARRDYDRERQLRQIALRESDVAQHRWPEASEILLACAAARHPDVKPEALFTQIKAGAYDFGALGDAPPPDTRGLFDRLKAQYDQSRDRYAALHPAGALAAAPASGARDKRWLDNENSGSSWDLTSVVVRGDGIVEAVQKTRSSDDGDTPEGLPDDADTRLAVDVDCRDGTMVPVERRWYAHGSDKLLLKKPTSVFGVWRVLSQRDGGDGGDGQWNEWSGPADGAGSEAANLCTQVAARCLPPPAPPYSQNFEIDPEQLGDASGAPLLLAAKRIWLAHRARFVPVCAVGTAR
ncbi:hypothetical protein ACVBGC_02000 [Burkholderia stagnalis]